MTENSERDDSQERDAEQGDRRAARQSGSDAKSRPSGAYRGPVERLLTAPIDQALAVQLEVANAVLSGEERTRESRECGPTTRALTTAVETFATATRLPTELLYQGVNPFRPPDERDDRPVERRLASQTGIDATEDRGEDAPRRDETTSESDETEERSPPDPA